MMKPIHKTQLLTCAKLHILPFALILTMLVTSSFADVLTDSERLQFANGLYAREMYELAFTEYRSFLDDLPESKLAGMAYFRLGESCRHTNDIKSAKKAFQVVFDDFPKSEFMYKAGFRLAGILAKEGNHKKAAKMYKELLKRKPPHDMIAASLYLQGISLIKAGLENDAIKVLDEVRKKHSSSKFCSYALLQLGQIYGRVGSEKQWELALQMYAAAEASPSDGRVGAEALFQMAELYFHREEYAKSYRAYCCMFKMYPDDRRSAEAGLQAAWAAHNAGLYADSLKLIKKISQSKTSVDSSDEWLYLKANCERQLMKNTEAVISYDELLKKYPGSRFINPAGYERAVVCYKIGRFEDVVNGALNVKITDAVAKDVYWLLAESYSALNKTDEAIQYYRLIVRDYSESDVAEDAMYRIAHHLQAKGEFKEASRNYNALVKKSPKSELAPKALFAAAFCLAKAGDNAGAARDWGLLVDKYSSSSFTEEAIYQKAMSEIRLGRDKEAIESILSLLKLFPETDFAANAHYWQGVLLSKTDKLSDAKDALRLALKKTPSRNLLREINFQLAGVLQQLGEETESAALFQPFLTSSLRSDFSPEMLEWLSQYWLRKKQYDYAIKAAEQIIETGRTPAWLQIGYCLIGRVQLANSDNKAAEDAFKKALSAKEHTRMAAESALWLGQITLTDKRYKDSTAYYRLAAKLAVGDDMLGIRARAYAGLGYSAMGQNNPKGAARYFMSVAVLFDDSELTPECLYQAAKAFEQAGENESAKKTMIELNERYPNFGKAE